MSIRQVRLNSLKKIQEEIGNYKGKKINIVLSNSTSVLGELISTEGGGILIRNQRQKDVRFNWNEILEVYFDLNA